MLTDVKLEPDAYAYVDTVIRVTVTVDEP